MNSFTLNQIQNSYAFSCLSSESEFKLLKVIIHKTSSTVNTRDLQNILSGFYLEIEECCSIGNELIRTRSRPFELLKEMDQLSNAINFDQIISNDLLDINGSISFYNQLNVKLQTRCEDSFDLNFEIYYDGENIAPLISF